MANTKNQVRKLNDLSGLQELLTEDNAVVLIKNVKRIVNKSDNDKPVYRDDSGRICYINNSETKTNDIEIGESMKVMVCKAFPTYNFVLTTINGVPVQKFINNIKSLKPSDIHDFYYNAAMFEIFDSTLVLDVMDSLKLNVVSTADIDLWVSNLTIFLEYLYKTFNTNPKERVKSVIKLSGIKMVNKETADSTAGQIKGMITTLTKAGVDTTGLKEQLKAIEESDKLNVSKQIIIETIKNNPNLEYEFVATKSLSVPLILNSDGTELMNAYDSSIVSIVDCIEIKEIKSIYKK